MSKVMRVMTVWMGLLGVWALGEEAPGVRRKVSDAGDGRPAIWQQAEGKDVLAAEEVARQDGIRKLIERIYGLKVDGETEVYDLVLASKDLESTLRGSLKGMKEEKTQYFDDGSCQKLMKVTLREVVEVIRDTYKRVEESGRVVSEEQIQKITTENRDKEIKAWGSGALPGSKGLQIIQAQRAAEVDCYEKLAARFLGMNVSAKTKVRDFVLASDQIKSTVSHGLKGVKWTDIRVCDQHVEADGELVLKTLIERVVRTYKRYVQAGENKVEDLEKTSQREESTVLKETGKAAYREEGFESGLALSEPYYVERKVVERVIRKEIAVE